ncbi:MAG: AlpA family phage regulatory protein [Phenylobacterium sp.]|jgi:predicted DNA-binding transcriptional regulator AlpA|uniref:helix-turn-helix transcriptional regulator n=1 Tax=Phenylobacterium sp. TaxID=1871053 RepID=UPI00356B47C7
MTSSTNKKLLAWITVRLMIGNLGRTTWWRLIRAGKAPRPIRISPGRVAWLESDILEWISEKQNTSR